MNKMKIQLGFTLIEIAVVLVIVSLLLGSFITSLSSRIETTRRNDTNNQLEDIKTALLGFASAQGRLPCPATAIGQGQEQPIGGGVCTIQHGFVPGRTLGINGNYNRDVLLLDSWGNPIRYSVATANVSAFTKPIGLGNGGIQDTGIATLSPELVICDRLSTSATACVGGAVTYVNATPFVLVSLGNDGNFFAGAIPPVSNQAENSGEALVVANAAGENIAYAVGGDNVFAKKDYSSIGSASGGFDDILIWVSPFILYSQMISVGQLP